MKPRKRVGEKRKAVPAKTQAQGPGGVWIEVSLPKRLRKKVDAVAAASGVTASDVVTAAVAWKLGLPNPTREVCHA